MKNTIKLPLFLGAVCLISTIALATVNAITAPIIFQQGEDARNAGYYEVLGVDGGLTKQATVTATGALLTAGIDEYVTFLNSTDQTIFGVVFNGSVGGFGSDPIVFQVGFKAGLYSGYKNISNSETPSHGATMLLALNEILTGLSATSNLATINNAIVAQRSALGLSSSVAVTRSNLTPALVAAATEYLSLTAV